MKTFWGIVPRYIRKSKSRVLFMATGIVLTMTLIVSLFITKEALSKAYVQKRIEGDGGCYDLKFSTTNYNALEKLKEDSIVSNMTIITPFGLSDIEDTKYSIKIDGYEDNIKDFLNFKLLDGRMPSNDKEIALESWVLDALPNEYKLGDKIKLNSALEYTDISGKKNIVREDEFIIVGTFKYTFRKNLQKNVGKAYVTREFAENNLAEKGDMLEGYIKINSQYSIDNAYKLLASTSEYKDIFISYNFSKETYLKAVSLLNKISYVLFVVVGIVASIIIYNIFNASVSERVREFGMLRAIGASKARIVVMVVGEGLLMGIIFIPIGIILGTFFTRFIIANIADIDGFNQVFVISKESVVVSIIIGFFSIILGSYGPAKRTGKISPIEAIESNNNLKSTGKRINATIEPSNVFQKRLKFSTNMAFVNIKRNKKRVITSVTSLVITIVLFMMSFYILHAIDPVTIFKNSHSGDFIITSNATMGIKDEELKGIYNLSDVRVGSKVREFAATVNMPKEVMGEGGLEDLKEKSYYSVYAKELFERNVCEFQVTGYALSDEELNKLKNCEIDGSIDVESMNNKPVVAIVQNMSNINYTNLKIGDSIDVVRLKYDKKGDFIGRDTIKFKVGAIVNKDALKNPYDDQHLALIYSYSAGEKYFDIEGYKTVELFLGENANYEKTKMEINDALNGIVDVKVSSFKEELNNIKQINLQISIVIYTFIFIVVTISLVNLINVMRMNIISRNKEIGMLRAIGMDEENTKSMIKMEGVLYGIFASLIGSTLGTVLTKVIYNVCRDGILKDAVWKFPSITIFVIFVVTTLSTTVSAMLPCKGLFRESIVDSIRSIE